MRCEPCFSGAMVELHRRFVRNHWGDEVLRRVLAVLEPRDADEIRNARPVVWVPVRAVDDFFEALAREVGEPVEEVQARVVSDSVPRNFRAVRRVLLRITGDQALLGRVASLYRRTYDTGFLSSEVIGPGAGRLELREWPDPPPVALRGLRIGLRNVLTMAGRQNVEVEHRVLPEGADFLARWDR